MDQYEDVQKSLQYDKKIIDFLQKYHDHLTANIIGSMVIIEIQSKYAAKQSNILKELHKLFSNLYHNNSPQYTERKHFSWLYDDMLLIPNKCFIYYFHNYFHIFCHHISWKINQHQRFEYLPMDNLQRYYHDQCIRAINLSHFNNINCQYLLTPETGQGKTRIMLNILIYMANNFDNFGTIIVVHTNAMQQEWQQELQIFEDRLSENINDLDKKIYVTTVQSMLKQESVSTDIMIVDESEYYCSSQFSKIYHVINAKMTFGLSATAASHVGDSCMKLYVEHFHNCMYVIIPPPDELLLYDSCVEIVQYNVQRYINYTKFIDEISADIERNNIILQYILKLHNDGRNIFVFTRKIDHVQIICDLAAQYLTDSCLIELKRGKFYDAENHKLDKDDFIKKEELIIVSTYSSGECGLDFPQMDALIMCTPIIDVRETIGRIFRKGSSSNKTRIIIDIYDKNSVACNQLDKRIECYKEFGAMIERR